MDDFQYLYELVMGAVHFRGQFDDDLDVVPVLAHDVLRVQLQFVLSLVRVQLGVGQHDTGWERKLTKPMIYVVEHVLLQKAWPKMTLLKEKFKGLKCHLRMPIHVLAQAQ